MLILSKPALCLSTYTALGATLALLRSFFFFKLWPIAFHSRSWLFFFLPAVICSKWCKTNHGLAWLVVALSESLFITYYLGWFTILNMSQFMFYSLFQDIMQIHERYFPEIEVHCIHRFNLIFSLARLPKGEIKEEKTSARYTQSRSIHCPERTSPKSFCHIFFFFFSDSMLVLNTCYFSWDIL